MPILPLQLATEALLFAATSPLSTQELKAALETHYQTTISNDDLQQTIDNIVARYADDSFAFEIVTAGGGYRFLTKPAQHGIVGAHLRNNTKKRLSQAALETLAVVAYRQPVSKSEVEQIRGVNCDYSIQKLLEKELLAIAGRAETAGRPLLYGTTPKFMEYFGINHLRELPQPKEFQAEGNEIGAATT